MVIYLGNYDLTQNKCNQSDIDSIEGQALQRVEANRVQDLEFLAQNNCYSFDEFYSSFIL